MSKSRSSILWTLSKEQCEQLISNSSTFSEILRKVNMCPGGGNLRTLRNVFNEYDLDYSKISTGLNSTKGKHFNRVCITNDILFTENSNVSRSAVKNRIIKEKLIPYVCAICGQKPVWNGQELVLILDHINGIRNDHRLENLRFLCPNCNAQQDTFCGKHLKALPKKLKEEEKEKLKQIFLEDIDKKCKRIVNSGVDFSKFGWVEKIAKLENVSHTSVRKFMRKYMKEFYYSKCYIRKNQFN